MTRDPALDWLLADAKSQGLTISEYERRYGVILDDLSLRKPSAASNVIRRHEIPAGLMTDGDIVMAEEKARRRNATQSACVADPWASLPGPG